MTQNQLILNHSFVKNEARRMGLSALIRNGTVKIELLPIQQPVGRYGLNVRITKYVASVLKDNAPEPSHQSKVQKLSLESPGSSELIISEQKTFFHVIYESAEDRLTILPSLNDDQLKTFFSVLKAYPTTFIGERECCTIRFSEKADLRFLYEPEL